MVKEIKVVLELAAVEGLEEEIERQVVADGEEILLIKAIVYMSATVTFVDLAHV